jgi:hypothetical protein
MKKGRNKILIYITLIIFELLVIKGIKLIYEKKMDALGGTNEVGIEKVVSVEEVDRKEDVVQNNLYSVSTNGYYYLCTVALTNYTADETYTPYLVANSASSDYLSVNSVDYYDNSYNINAFGYSESIPPLTTVNKEYIVYSSEELEDLTLSVYDYTTDKNSSTASITLD